MVKFIGKRLAYAVLTLFLITTATFFLVAGAPGDPIAAKVGQMPEQAQQIIREKYGLDQPVVKPVYNLYEESSYNRRLRRIYYLYRSVSK